MDNLEVITMFFQWCVIINFSIYAFSSLILMVFKNIIKTLHSKLLGINIEELDKLYFSYLANFQMLIIVFFLAPYIALKIMTS